MSPEWRRRRQPAHTFNAREIWLRNAADHLLQELRREGIDAFLDQARHVHEQHERAPFADHGGDADRLDKLPELRGERDAAPLFLWREHQRCAQTLLQRSRRQAEKRVQRSFTHKLVA